MKFICLFTSLIAISAFTQVFGQLDGSIYFLNGDVAEGEVLSANSSSFTWRNYDTDQTVSTPHSSISRVDFSPIESWSEAEELFTQARYDEAAQAYLKITENPAESLYPVLGNYASLALRKAMTCYRRLLDPKKVSAISSRVEKEFKTMPATLQQFSPTEKAWIAAGKGNWQEVIKIAESNTVVGVDSTELSFLAAEGNQQLGKKLEALDYYTKAYSFGYGASPRVAKLSLRKSAEILGTIEDADRADELKSQLNIYKQLFGQGNLWSGAPASFVKLSNEKLATADFSMGESELSQTGDLPPLADRDWIHPLELDSPMYVIGKGPLSLPKAGSADRPERKDKDYIFDGDDFGFYKDALELSPKTFEAKLIFVSEAANGLIFSAGEINKGVALFVKGGDLTLVWQTAKGARDEVVLTKIFPNKEVSIHLLVTDVVKVRLGFEGDFKEMDKIPKKTTFDKAYTFYLAPDEKQDLVTDEKLPRFKGRMRYLSVGTSDNYVSLRKAEKEMHDGKGVQVSEKAVKK